MTTSNESIIVMVPVPVSRLQEAYEVLARPGRVTQAGLGSTQASALEPRSDEVWNSAALRKLYIESNEAQRSVLDYLAEHPGKEVTSRQIADALNLPKGTRSLAGLFGGLGRRALTQHKTDELPWEHRGRAIVDGSAPDGSSETVLVMADHVAEAFKAAKKSSDRR